MGMWLGYRASDYSDRHPACGLGKERRTQISKCIGSHTTCNPYSLYPYSVFPLQSSELASVPFSLLLTWPPEGWVSVLGDCGGGGGGGGYYCPSILSV